MSGISISTRGIISGGKIKYIPKPLEITVEVRDVDISIDVKDIIDIDIKKE